MGGCVASSKGDRAVFADFSQFDCVAGSIKKKRPRVLGVCVCVSHVVEGQQYYYGMQYSVL